MQLSIEVHWHNSLILSFHRFQEHIKSKRKNDYLIPELQLNFEI
jgi:hypothetical protein